MLAPTLCTGFGASTSRKGALLVPALDAPHVVTDNALVSQVQHLPPGDQQQGARRANRLINHKAKAVPLVPIPLLCADHHRTRTKCEPRAFVDCPHRIHASRVTNPDRRSRRQHFYRTFLVLMCSLHRAVLNLLRFGCPSQIGCAVVSLVPVLVIHCMRVGRLLATEQGCHKDVNESVVHTSIQSACSRFGC